MFVLVECKHGHHIKKHNDYTLSEEVDCEMHRSEIIKMINNTTCNSYYRLVPLKPMPLQEFRPSVVSVKRCDGHCRRTVCMPLRKRIIKVPVKSDNMCALVEVEEHIDCKCMCLQKKEDCTDRQYYNKAHCACMCKDHKIKKRECEEGTMKVWDDTDCTCNCTQMNRECTSGLNWNHQICACN